MKQGGISDCYFISALSTVAIKPEIIEAMVVTQEPKKGFYQIKFFKQGKPVIVTIDDLLPFRKKKNALCFASCSDVDEL